MRDTFVFLIVNAFESISLKGNKPRFIYPYLKTNLSNHFQSPHWQMFAVCLSNLALAMKNIRGGSTMLLLRIAFLSFTVAAKETKTDSRHLTFV